MPAREPLDDIGPDPDMELEPADDVQLSPDCRIELVVPFERELLSALSQYAREQGINAIEAVQRLVDEALAAHARR